MRVNPIIALILFFAMANLSGCGFGGFNGPSNTADGSSSPNPPAAQQISGVAAKGLFRNGTVRFYQLQSDGTVGALLRTSTTDAFGSYSTHLSLTGAVLLKASGSYADEATGGELSIDENAPLRAAISQLSSLMRISVTPLTELAVRYAEARAKGDPLVASFDITAANALLTDVFKVNVVASHPIGLSQASFGNSNASQSNKDYSLALAAVSQSALDDYGGSLSSLLADWGGDISRTGALSAVNAAQFKAALTAFLGSEKNQSGLRDINLTNLVNAGGSVKAFRLVTSGTLATAQSIGGIVLTLQLPANVTVRADFAAPPYKPLGGVVTTSGVVPPDTNSEAVYTPGTGLNRATLTIGLAHQTGFTVGEFATVYCDIPAGATVQASDFVLTSFEAVDADGGVPLSSVTAAVN